jgi:hypothetical protein
MPSYGGSLLGPQTHVYSIGSVYSIQEPDGVERVEKVGRSVPSKMFIIYAEACLLRIAHTLRL